MSILIDDNSLKFRIYNLTGSAIAKNTASALFDEDTDSVSTTIRIRKENILGLIQTSVNSPRIKLMNPNSNSLIIDSKTLKRLNDIWPIELAEDDVRQLVILVDKKSAYKNRSLLLKELKDVYSNELTADIVSKTVSILRGAGLLSDQYTKVFGTAVLGKKSAMLGKFILGDGYNIVETTNMKEYPGISPIQAYDILSKAQKIVDIKSIRGR